MSSHGANYRLFWQEFRRTFHSTGALLPSGRRLCKALARHTVANGRPRRLLEVGPGTGVATDCIIVRMGPQDSLELVELNDKFVAALRERLAADPGWQSASQRVHIHHMSIEELSVERPYDAIVSGLPLNNFSVDAVRNILAKFAQLAAAGGTLSFFEYIGVRNLKALICGRKERLRLTGVERAIHEATRNHGIDRQCILANIPPAWVHHLRFP